MNWKFSNLGACKLKISKFGGLWAKILAQIEAVEAKISKFSQKGSCELTLLLEMGPLRTTGEGWKGGLQGRISLYPFSRSVPPPPCIAQYKANPLKIIFLVQNLLQRVHGFYLKVQSYFEISIPWPRTENKILVRKWLICRRGDMSVYQQRRGTSPLICLNEPLLCPMALYDYMKCCGSFKTTGPEQTMMHMRITGQRVVEIAMMHAHITGHWCHLSPPSIVDTSRVLTLDVSTIDGLSIHNKKKVMHSVAQYNT